MNRCKHDLLQELLFILNANKTGISRTMLSSKVNYDYKKLLSVLNILREKGIIDFMFIEKKNRSGVGKKLLSNYAPSNKLLMFVITEKGKEYLKKMDEINSLWKSK